MDMISRELRKIDAAGAEAMSWVECSEWRKARRALKKIRSSFCVVESERVITFIEAEILSRQGQHEAAAALIKKNLYALWGYHEALIILNRTHPQIAPESRTYLVSIKGGNRIIGYYDHYLGHFEVVANSLDEALRYIAGLEIYPADQPLNVYGHIVMEELGEFVSHCGVVYCSPFELTEDAMLEDGEEQIVGNG